MNNKVNLMKKKNLKKDILMIKNKLLHSQKLTQKNAISLINSYIKILNNKINKK